MPGKWPLARFDFPDTTARAPYQRTAERLRGRNPPMIYKAPIPTRAQRAAQVFASEKLANRDKRRDFIWTMLECWLWAAIGTGFVAWAFHTTDEGASKVSLLFGLLINNVGILQALARAYLRGEKRGDW